MEVKNFSCQSNSIGSATNANNKIESTAQVNNNSQPKAIKSDQGSSPFIFTRSERGSSRVQRSDDLPVMHEQTPIESVATPGTKPHPPSNQVILPSISAPECNILNLLEECNASGI
ncbi:Uncharacterized protein Fot_28149 [Forsythia ovata]|uniref:Uncharacterized protein n=1 Tax=Forsythia ovata TaxID=205694 RepID=A0ABD1TNL0_9LAMI